MNVHPDGTFYITISISGMADVCLRKFLKVGEIVISLKDIVHIRDKRF